VSLSPTVGRNARGLFAKLQNFAARGAPDAPAIGVRDPWPGDPGRGARLVKGELDYGGAVLAMAPGVFALTPGSAVMRAHLHGFTWLRDLRALGTDAARGRARALVSAYFDERAPDAAGAGGDVTGARIAAWLGHYDFFAASADDEFRQKLMARLVAQARNLAASLPVEMLDARAFTALKGVMAASVAMPAHSPAMARALKFLVPELARQVGPDGLQGERSPAAQLATLQDLTEIRALTQAAGVEPPGELVGAIERAASALRALRHGDGGLALFNGSREELGSLIDLVLAQAGRARGAVSQLAGSGFVRLVGGRSLVLMDAGAPPPPGLDRLAHAGTLGFEFSVAKERIIVNCGAAPAQGPDWRDALRGTAAHSTLTIADVSSSELLAAGLGRRPGRVTAERRDVPGASYAEASHDGWEALFGAVHYRRIGLMGAGDEVLGEEVIEATNPQPFTIRFHLHPNITANMQQDGQSVLLRTASGQGWRLRTEDVPVRVEESIYFGGGEARRSLQIVLAGHQDGPQHVKWSLTRF
jgi:uncharacterized heparinase superfamily protein